MMATTATQRATGDRGPRHDRRQVSCPRRHLRALAPQIHQRAVFVVKPAHRGLLIDVQPSLVQHQPPRLILVHQRDVMGRDDHRGAGFVEFDEQPQQSPSSVGSTLPVGSSASNRCGREITARAIAARCFSPPDRIGGSASIRSPRPDPFQEIDHLLAVSRFLPAPSPGTAAPRFHMSSCDRRRRKSCNTMPISLCAGRRFHPCTSSETSWPNRLTRPRVGRSDRNNSRSSESCGAGGTGEKLERVRGNLEAEGRAESPGRARNAIRHFEPNQAQLRSCGTRPETSCRRPAARRLHGGGEPDKIVVLRLMVSDSLTVAL